MEGNLHVTIYLDAILLISFIFNGAILLLVSYIVKLNTRIWRLIIGSLIATIFVPLTLYFPHSFINTVVGKGLYSIFIVIVTFGFISFHQLFKQLLTFYSISFIAGGSLLSIHYILEDSVQTSFRRLFLYVNNMDGQEISLVVLFLGFPLTLYVTKIWSDKLIVDRYQRDQLYNILLEWNDHRHETVGFLDSGNQLSDPLTNRPVIVCDSFFMKKFFSESDWLNVKRAIEKNEIDRIPDHLYSHISIIPFKTIAGENHYLFAIKPDKLIIQTNENKMVIQKVLVGIQLSPISNDQSYHCLLHPKLMTLQPVEMV